MKKYCFVALMLAAASILPAGTAIAADPTLHEVYQAADSGHLKQAQTMMDQVLRDHPNSAKAHYVEAELMAKTGELDRARSEFATAERLAPGLPFAKTDAVAALRVQLEPRGRAPSATNSPVTFSWPLIGLSLALIAAAIFFFRSMNRSSPVSASTGPLGTPNSSFGNGQPTASAGAAIGAPGGGMGSGILGGLATGAAVGAGMVAGEALMHRVLGNGGDRILNAAQAAPADYPLPSDVNEDLGGTDFGINDTSSWVDDGGSVGGSDDWT